MHWSDLGSRASTNFRGSEATDESPFHSRGTLRYRSEIGTKDG